MALYDERPLLLTEDCGLPPFRALGASGAAPPPPLHGIRTSNLSTLDAKTLYREIRRVPILHIDKYQEFLRMFILYCSK